MSPGPVTAYLDLMAEMRKRMAEAVSLHQSRYESIEALVRAQGSSYVPQEPTPEELADILGTLEKLLRVDRDFGIAKSCYRSAFLLATAGSLAGKGEFTYVEYANHTIPTLHAWCLYDGRILVDPTYRMTERWGMERRTRASLRQSVIGTPKSHMEYYGIQFPVEYLEENTETAGGSFLDDWQRGWPLVQGGLPWEKTST